VELKELIRGAHSLIEAREKKRITQEEMASRVGVGYRTYLEYQRGTNAPLAMKALLNLLSLLDDQEIVRVVREWKDDEEKPNELGSKKQKASNENS
jgi:putative transcriptional regulator